MTLSIILQILSIFVPTIAILYQTKKSSQPYTDEQSQKAIKSIVREHIDYCDSSNTATIKGIEKNVSDLNLEVKESINLIKHNQDTSDLKEKQIDKRLVIIEENIKVIPDIKAELKSNSKMLETIIANKTSN